MVMLTKNRCARARRFSLPGAAARPGAAPRHGRPQAAARQSRSRRAGCLSPDQVNPAVAVGRGGRQEAVPTGATGLLGVVRSIEAGTVPGCERAHDSLTAGAGRGGLRRGRDDQVREPTGPAAAPPHPLLGAAAPVGQYATVVNEAPGLLAVLREAGLHPSRDGLGETT